MVSAIADQLPRLAFNTNWGTAHPPSIELAQRLAELMPGDLNHAFFTSGGSEAVEAAWKIVREHFEATGQPQRRKAIARNIAYHGVTLGALAFTGVAPMKAAFGPPPIDVTHVSNTNAFRAPDGDDPEAFCRRLLAEVRDAIDAAGPDEVALIIAEPVQNAGGCLLAPPGYWQGLREIADECGALLLADEVICAFGRLGEWLGIEREGVVPDLATVAKGMTSAYAPMGAVLVSDRVAEPLYQARRPAPPRDHVRRPSARRGGRAARTSRSSSATACSRTCAATRPGSRSASRSCARCRSWATCAGAGSSGPWSSSATPRTSRSTSPSATACSAGSCPGGCSRPG